MGTASQNRSMQQYLQKNVGMHTGAQMAMDSVRVVACVVSGQQ
jgi:hypothetical protein